MKSDYFVRSIPKALTYEWLMKKHYARRIPSISYSFGLYLLDDLVGVLTYGIPASDNSLLMCGEKWKPYAIELNRLVKNDSIERNLQSWFVARSFELLPKPLIILSYSDPNNGHFGYTYQSLNFIYTGTGGSDEEFYLNGKQFTSRHLDREWFLSRRLKYDENLSVNDNFLRIGGKVIKLEKKHRYVLFLGNKREKRDMLRNLVWPVLPYVKGNNSNYDTSYQTHTQLVLI